MATAKAATPVALPELQVQTLELTVVGTSPLITHAWSEKITKQIRDKQMKKATAAKEAKDPQVEYEGAMYRDSDGDPCFPANAFKLAAVRAGKLLGMAMTDTKQTFFVRGETVKVRGEPRMREDMVRLQGNTADIRYRPEFPEWEVTLLIDFNPALISDEQVVNLINAAGFSVGVGEWRPEKNGNYGRFQVA